MDIVLRDLVGTECYTFIDDVIVYGNTIEEHARRLEHVLQGFERANLQLQPSKCVFARPEVEYLGYILSRDGIQASPAKTQAVRDFPVPRNERKVRSFLGLASFYRRLVSIVAQHTKRPSCSVRTLRLSGNSGSNQLSRNSKRPCVLTKYWRTQILRPRSY
jgi:hypothetical protein